MPTRRLIEPGVFAPELVTMMGNVFEDVLKTLGLKRGDDPVTTLIAHRIVELVQGGEQDPERLKQLTLQAFRGNGPGRA